MSLKAVHMLSIVRKDTAMKSLNFVCTSLRSSSIFVDFYKYILRFVCLVLLILMLVSTKTMVVAFKDILLKVMEKHVPSKLSRSKQTYPWITTEVRKIINKKNKAGRKVRKTNNQKDRDRFRKLRSTKNC
jgi:hypothetical protein